MEDQVTTKTKWVKTPASGEFRGEGTWKRLQDTHYSDQDWTNFRETGFLPTAYTHQKPPDDPRNLPKTPMAD